MIWLLCQTYYALPQQYQKLNASRLIGKEIFSVHWVVIKMRGNKKEEKCNLWPREKKNLMYKLYVKRMCVGIAQN